MRGSGVLLRAGGRLRSGVAVERLQTSFFDRPVA
jgi:hypothetical protein